MERDTFESAIVQFRQLLEARVPHEEAYQSWLQTNDIVFHSLGYQRVIPQPLLTRNGVLIYKPDFLAQRIDGTWDIVEIKTPFVSILRNILRRKTFYAEMQEYIAQCFEYCEYFDDEASREEFRQRYEISIHKGISCVLVAGQSDHYDRFEVLKILARFGGQMRHLGYDEVLRYVEFFRMKTFSRNENLPGLSIHLLMVLGKLHSSDNYLYDVGTDECRNRVSIFIDKSDRLCLRVFDDEGEQTCTKISLSDIGYQYGAAMYLAFEIGMGEDYSIMAMEINGKCYADRKLERMHVDVSQPHAVIGSDVTGKEWSAVGFMQIVIYSRTLEFDERWRLRSRHFDRILETIRQGGRVPRIRTRGRQFMYSKDHPNFVAPSSGRVGAKPPTWDSGG